MKIIISLLLACSIYNKTLSSSNLLIHWVLQSQILFVIQSGRLFFSLYKNFISTVNESFLDCKFLQEVHMRKEKLPGIVFVLQRYRLWGMSLYSLYFSLNNEDCHLYSILHGNLPVSRLLQREPPTNMTYSVIHCIASPLLHPRTESSQGSFVTNMCTHAKKVVGVCIVRCIHTFNQGVY